MSDRCIKTDLLVAQCGDTCCRPDLNQRTGRADKANIKATFTARHHSACDNCDGRIKPDELMGLDDNEDRYCERCLS